MQVSGRSVARLTGIDHENGPAGAGQNQGCGQSGGSPADDHDVVSVHVLRLLCGRLVT